MPVFFEMTSSFYPTTLPLLDSLTSTLCHMHCPSNRIITTMPEAEYCNKVAIMRTLFPSLDCGQFTTLEHKLKNALISVCLIVILSLIIVMPSYINASSNPPVLFRKGSSSYVTPYSEWLKNSWLWWIGIPNNEHPFPNYDSKTCSVHQQGPVWYLPDVEPTGQLTHASVKYSCEISKGKAIFFPLTQSSCWLANPEFKKFSNKLAPDPESDQALKTCAISQVFVK